MQTLSEEKVNAKRKDRSNDDILKELLHANGICYEKLGQEGGSISSLEIFFSGFPRIVGLSFFPNLCRLTIVGQEVKVIEGLKVCPLLEELWVVQCHLTEISGLHDSLQLKKLYLYENIISEIKNLDMLTNLEVLWLNNNQIRHIEGLKTLVRLKDLNLADNKISTIGHSLVPNINLQNLNLSGNKIRSFKELIMLTRLPNLTELLLKYPTSPPNPVCLLSNYTTHVLYHLPQLLHLDTYDVSSKEAKEAAESTVMKKIMYYNMRVHAAERSLEEMRLRLLEKKKTMSKVPEERIRVLTHCLKNLERELCRKSGNKDEGQRDRNDSNSSESLSRKILRKMDNLKERLVLWTRRMTENEEWFRREMVLATNMLRYTVKFLVMELENVGNILLEEGCSSDPWFTTCDELLLSRFTHLDYRPLGIVGIKTKRVVRVQNRDLRLRFEEKLHTVVTGGDAAHLMQNYRRRLEYLLHVPEAEPNKEMDTVLQIIEEGFKSAQDYQALGKEAAVPLSNSLFVTDKPRMDHALRQAWKNPTDPVAFKHGLVIFSKVFLGQSQPVRDSQPVNKANYPLAESVYRNVDSKQKNGLSKDAAKCLFDTPVTLIRRRHWFIFDHELVLPEYIVYFEYITEAQEQSDSLSGFVRLDKEVLNMDPVLKSQPKLSGLDEKILLHISGANLLSQIVVLNLHSCGLSSLKEISSLTALQRLTLSFNEFTHLKDLAHMTTLEFLDASYNHLETLEGMKGLMKLKELDVRWNQLSNAKKDASALRRHAPALAKLDTRYNSWIKIHPALKSPKSVRMTILGHLVNLTHLDDMPVTESESTTAAQIAAGFEINQQAALLSHSRVDKGRPRRLSLLSTAQLLCTLCPSPWDVKNLEPDWPVKITALNLDNQRISKIMNLNRLINLRWASFNDNLISKVEGLEFCRKLEELFLNNNCISSLDGLPKLPLLSKLCVDGNQLSSLDTSALEQMPSILLLSVDNNCITSLHGVHRARSLLELYAGNNQISTSRDVHSLKGLRCLSILDLHGNPLIQKLENYRMYVIFHLPSIKALDGCAVDETEVKSSKAIFQGRLNTDMVVEQLGHSNYGSLSELSLQSCSIRLVDLTPAEVFVNLVSINLDHNSLTSFSGLIYLPSVKVLSLNYNHVESILPVQKSSRHLLYSKVNSSGYGQRSNSRGNRKAGPSDALEPLMSSLELLSLTHNGIANMANLQLSRLTNLKSLFLQDNQIRQVEGLEGLHQLQELVLERNWIKTVARNAFSSLDSLVELRLAENRLRELNHLQPLTELRKLHLDANKLQDSTEIDKLEVLPSLTELSLIGNPMSRYYLHRPVTVLRLNKLEVLDGKTISLEERSRAELLRVELPQDEQEERQPSQPGSKRQMYK
ncbi:leucine-rich repeat-containing protein 9 isoform X2 [Synchiropus splendidus]|uniref:leucine-rich repeat-containing protein 9 isoform X2 n=1 Tax=Synchiropus splendidus TaxID=270530 RepID=UPI00237ECF32|nr:leucine-rich repeat-containing protein 9 isoform X2 [Synchiropus splendidus]